MSAITANGDQSGNTVMCFTYCDPCKDETKLNFANGYCVDCNDYLCKECYSVHRKPKPSRHHVLVDRTSMPTKKTSVKSESNDVCEIHKDQSLVYYCREHDVVACDVCQKVEHRRCSQDRVLEKITGAHLDMTKFNSVIGELRLLKLEFEQSEKVAVANSENIKRSYRNVIAAVGKVKDTDVKMNLAIHFTCKKMAQDIESLKKKLRMLYQENKHAEAFICLMDAQEQADDYWKYLELVRSDNKLFEYNFVPCPKKRLGFYGKIGYFLKDPLEGKNMFVSCSSDTEDCHVTGLEILDSNRLILTDHRNNKLKLVDIEKRVVVQELKLDVKPWDLVKIQNNTVAVTGYGCPSKTILVTVDEEMKVADTVRSTTIGNYWGITLASGKNHHDIITCYYGDIQIMAFGGAVMKYYRDKVISEEPRVTKFGNVRYIALGQDKKTIYLSDTENNSVSIMNLEGEITDTFQSDDLQQPKGISVGNNGRVFVCSFEKNMILEISQDLSEGEVILDSSDDIKAPESVLYDEKDNRLFVGSKSKEIMVFMV